MRERFRMGCFLGCFGSSKEEKRRNRRNHRQLLRDQGFERSDSLQNHTLPREKVISAEPLNLTTDLPDGIEEEISLITRKNVTFDSNVKIYEPVAVHESAELLNETGENDKDQRGSSEKSSLLSNSHSEDDSISSSVGSYPPNHRYQNCRDSDDEIDAFEREDSDLDEDNNDIGEYSDCDEDDSETFGQNAWAESVPTESMESRIEISPVLADAEEVDSRLTPCNRNARLRSIYAHQVLNPVENVAQWKGAKSKATPQLKPQKENFAANQEESRLSFSFLSKSDQPANQNQDISVDTSLSNWLPSSKSTPVKKSSLLEIETEGSYSQGSNSVTSIEERPILGALTVEDIKQFSTTNSPRRSPSRSPDEMPIIGSVGRYWNSSGYTKESNSASSYKGRPNSTSKNREDKKVIWHSTTFETRLERALKRGDNEA